MTAELASLREKAEVLDLIEKHRMSFKWYGTEVRACLERRVDYETRATLPEAVRALAARLDYFPCECGRRYLVNFQSVCMLCDDKQPVPPAEIGAQGEGDGA